jgi:hypothetical protein
VAIAEGAHFRGSVDMQRKGAQAQPAKSAAQQTGSSATPAQAPAAQAAQPARV